MRDIVLLLVLMLCGCMTTQITENWDMSVVPPKMMSCHATMTTLWHDTTEANFAVCSGKASTKESKTADSAPSLNDLLNMYNTASKAGLVVSKPR